MSFVDNYVAHIPDSEVPDVWNPWMAIFSLATVSAGRVWFDNGSRLMTDIYVMMIGPSGSGKDTAAKPMLTLLGLMGDTVHYMDGTITKAALHDELTEHHCMSVIATEMLNSYGSNDVGQEFFRAMTAYYNVSDRLIRERTRTHGDKILGTPDNSLCINWLVGTTMDWLRPMIQHEHVRGGLLGRMLIVQGTPTKKRIPRRKMPADIDIRRGKLIDHLTSIATSTPRPMDFNTKAARIQHDWYMSRTEPDDPDLDSWWRRENDNITKLSMLMALSDNPYATVITEKDWTRSYDMVTKLFHDLPNLLNDLPNSPNAQSFRMVKEHLDRSGVLNLKDLYIRMQRYGIWSRTVDTVLMEMEKAGTIIRDDDHVTWVG
jgi:hypothetical protein